MSSDLYQYDMNSFPFQQSQEESSFVEGSASKDLTKSLSASLSQDFGRAESTSVDVAAGAADRGRVEKLEFELAETRKDLFRAVEGWKKDREDLTKKLQSVKASSDAVSLKQSLSACKSKARGAMAAHSEKISELQRSHSDTKSNYEEKLAKIRAKLDRVMERKFNSDKIKNEQIQKLTLENARLKSERDSSIYSSQGASSRDPRSSLEAVRGENDTLRVQVQLLTAEIERLKVSLSGSVPKPRRAPPPTPPSNVRRQLLDPDDDDDE